MCVTHTDVLICLPSGSGMAGVQCALHVCGMAVGSHALHAQRGACAGQCPNRHAMSAWHATHPLPYFVLIPPAKIDYSEAEA
jgi:hypothetical protein